jgi:hypothetical protein
MKTTKQYAALIWENQSGICEQGPYCDTKIEALVALRQINENADMRMKRKVDKIARNNSHCIQLALDNRFSFRSYRPISAC